MKAIVLTCDKYLPLTDHTINTYQNVWPSNPFRFRVPYGENRHYAIYLKEKYGDKIELVQTDYARVIHLCKSADERNTNDVKVSLIKPTILNLLEDIADDEWIYWCPDDKYIIEINEIHVNQIYEWLKDIKDVNISSILFSRYGNLLDENNLMTSCTISDNYNRNYLRRGDYKKIWNPQFLRAKVLKTLFQNFPDQPFVGKQMDYFKNHLSVPKDQKLFVSEKNYVTLGESTSKGKLTKNCAYSLKRYALQFPTGFELSDMEIVTDPIS